MSNNAPSKPWDAIASSADGCKVVAVTGGGSIPGGIYISTNSGTTWTETGAPSNYWDSVASSADGARLIAGAGSSLGGSIYTSTDYGVTWMSNSVPTNYWWRSVASSADGNELVAVSSGVYTLRTTPMPVLNMTPAGDNLTVSWLVPSTNFVLQQNSDLTTTNWTVMTNAPVLNLTNLQNQVILSPSGSNAFYRLKTP
jgi:hypothetical protein